MKKSLNNIYKKINVLTKILMGILLLGGILMTTVYGYEDYNEIGDPGVKVCTFGMRAFQVHYTNYMFYTIVASGIPHVAEHCVL